MDALRNPAASPGRLDRREWWATLKRTVREFSNDNLTDWAAALTYYGVMSLFPMLIALVAVLGIVGQEKSVFTLIGSTDSNSRLAYLDVSIFCVPTCTPKSSAGTSLRKATLGLVSSRCTAKPSSAPTSPP